MKNGFILIIPSGKNHGWIPANHLLQHRRRILTGIIRFCSVFVGIKKVCYITNLRPNEIVTADRYQQQLCRLSDELMQKRSFHNRRKVILLYDNARPHVAKSVKQTLLNEKSSRIQRILQTLQRRIIISSDQCNTHLRTNTSPVTKKSKNGWMNGSPRKTAFYRRGIALLPEKGEN